jgi:hypothetical protein
VANTQGGRGVAERARSVGGDHDVEPRGECRKERGDVALSPTDFGERDQQKQARPARPRV